MKTIISVTGLALSLIAGSVALTPASAVAQNLELQIGPNGIKPVVRERDRVRRNDRCDEREARAVARDSGLRDPEVVRVTDNRVVVEGMTRRGPERITLANERGCPEI